MKFFAALCLCSLLAACGNFAGQSVSNCEDNCSSSSTGNSTLNAKVTDINASVSGGVHDGTPVINKNDDTDEITFSLPLTGGSYLSSTSESYDLEGVENAQLSINNGNSGVTRIEITLPLSALKKGHNLETTETLPNGESIPSFSKGPHGYIDLNIEGTNLRVYLSQGHLGLYIDSVFDPYVQVNYPLMNKDEQVLGYLSQIPALAHSQGAFFMSMVLPKESLENL